MLDLSEREMECLRGREIGLVLRSPLASLNRAMRVGARLAEAWKAHRSGFDREVKAAVRRVLVRVGLPDSEEFRRRYPAHVSAGQAPRVLIAIG